MLMEQLGINSETEWAQQAATALVGLDGVRSLLEGHDAQVAAVQVKLATLRLVMHQTCRAVSPTGNLTCLTEMCTPGHGISLLALSVHMTVGPPASQREESTLDEMVAKALPRDHPMYPHIALSLDEVKRNPFWRPEQKQKFVGGLLKEVTR
jgi:hypothetical protein